MRKKYTPKKPRELICPVCGKKFVLRHHTAINCSNECTVKATLERAKHRRQEEGQIGYGLEFDPWQNKALSPIITENALLDPLPC